MDGSEANLLDDVFLALGHPARRRILTRLAQGAATVGEIAAPFNLSLNAVSKHLKILERAGLITREVKGREHYCRLSTAPLERASGWLDYHWTFWAGRLDALENELAVRQRAKRGGRE